MDGEPSERARIPFCDDFIFDRSLEQVHGHRARRWGCMRSNRAGRGRSLRVRLGGLVLFVLLVLPVRHLDAKEVSGDWRPDRGWRRLTGSLGLNTEQVASIMDLGYHKTPIWYNPVLVFSLTGWKSRSFWKSPRQLFSRSVRSRWDGDPYLSRNSLIMHGSWQEAVEIPCSIEETGKQRFTRLSLQISSDRSFRGFKRLPISSFINGSDIDHF